MTDLFTAGQDLQQYCDNRGWRSCFIGGIAVLRWGDPRVTRDLDLTLLTGFGAEEGYVDGLLAHYQPRISDARAFAIRSRTLLLATPEGIGIDISLGALPFEEGMVTRATEFSFRPGASLRTCSAEDLLVMKLFAARPIDIRDAESVAVRQKGQLDWIRIERELAPLVEIKDDPAIPAALKRLQSL